MEKSRLSNLAAAIATNHCALFAGAGLTAESGGATWEDLVKFLKEKFKYVSPLKNNFQIMGDICRKFKPEIVYNAVKERLENARISEPVSKLMTLPWFTTFTTNYDLALEESLVAGQSRCVRVILSGQEYSLSGLQSEVLCVKLMGSLDINYGQPGSMILDSGDLAIAREQRSRLFDILASHAANISFLFIGYSFDDKLFFEMLEKLMKSIGKSKNTYYAVFKEPPDDEKSYLLKEYGVEVIVADLKSFTKKLHKEVMLRNPNDLTSIRIPIGQDVALINSTNVGKFLSLYNPVLFEDLEANIPADQFFKGQTVSFKPFALNWHFQRSEIDQIIDAVIAQKKRDRRKSIIIVEGYPGSGRTFVILAAVYELIKKHRAIAIKIPSYAFNFIPTPEDLASFLAEIQKTVKLAGIDGFKRIVFWAEFRLEMDTISSFKKLTYEFEDQIPISLIFEDITPSVDNLSETDERIPITVDAKLSDEKKEKLAKYLITITRVHKFPEISEDETTRIIDEEGSFLPIMYRTLDPARRSINRIVQEEFSKITDSEGRACIFLCALPSSLNMELPITVLRKALSEHIARHLSYPDTFEIVEEKAKAFIKESMDHRTNPLVSIYHSFIAQYIVELVGASKMDECLLCFAKTVDIRSRIEAEFIGNLFITKGVNLAPSLFRPFTADGLKSSLFELKHRQPARPIIHHLARLLEKEDINNKNIVSLLREALAEPTESYALVERKENVLTTLAMVEWRQKKDRLITYDRKDSEIQDIIDLLIKARESVSPNIHPYDAHARILKELLVDKDEESRIILLNEAIEVINEGLLSCSDDPQGTQRLNDLLLDLLLEVNPKRAEETAKEFLETNKDGTGYYTLALMEYYKKQNHTKASLFLDKAMTGNKYPNGVIALKIDILLKDKFPNYDYLLKLVDLLTSKINYRDNWLTAYHKAIVYFIKDRGKDSSKHFKISYKSAPRTLQRRIRLFWMEKGYRKVHHGKIGLLTEREGRIYSHNIEGWKDDIFFNPRVQKNRNRLQQGLFVAFELGFSPRGPIAFEVHPDRTPSQFRKKRKM